MQTQIQAPPDISKAPRAANDTALHYGYVAYKDINLASSYGLDYFVQPPDSPYYRVLPSRQLIPFTNTEFPEVNENVAGAMGVQRKGPLTILKGKTAGECAKEVEQAYEAWGFTVLYPLTGYSVQAAFRIFQVIQPFPYKLKDIELELENADDRIEHGGPAFYNGEAISVPELTEAEIGVALKVRDLMLNAAKVAADLGATVRDNTIDSMNSRFSGGIGKGKADPHDKYIFNEFDTELPKLVNTEKPTEVGVLEKLAGLIAQPSNDTSEVDAVLARLTAKEAELDAKLSSASEIEAKWNEKYRSRFEKKTEQGVTVV
jgi:hypothetical protein